MTYHPLPVSGVPPLPTVGTMMGKRGVEPDTTPAATVSSEFGTRSLAFDSEFTFGRGGDADLRVGAAPIYDEVVPRIAGRVVAMGDRVFVENLDDSLALDLRVEGRPLMSLSPGHMHSPIDPVFDILITGSITTYELAVRVNRDRISPRWVRIDATPDELDPPTGATPELSPRQRSILDAYVRPLQAGGTSASHQQVAEELGISRSLVRVECEKIWSALFLAGVPMRDLGNARDEIVDAWSRHRI